MSTENFEMGRLLYLSTCEARGRDKERSEIEWLDNAGWPQGPDCFMTKAEWQRAAEILHAKWFQPNEANKVSK